MRLFLIAATMLALGASAEAEVNVRIASITDSAEKALHVDLVKRSLRALDVPMIDVVVTKLECHADGHVTASIEVVLSNTGGIRSIAQGKASFVAPKQQLRNQAALRKEALGYALEAVHKKLRASTRPVS